MPRMLFEGVFRLNRKLWMIPLSALMLLDIAGCNNQQNSINRSDTDPARPLGYYSNESHPDQNYNFLNDNDGALPEIMDHTFGDEGRLSRERKNRILQTRDENGNPPNPTVPLASEDRNFLQRDNRFSTSDINYHGHLNKKIGTNGVKTDKDFQDKVTNQIRDAVADVPNVRSIRSVAYGNTIWVSVVLLDNSKAAETKKAIADAVKPYADGKKVTVVTDEGAIGRDRNIHNDIPQKEPHEPKNQ